MRPVYRFLSGVCCLLAMILPAVAHHSLQDQYDVGREASIAGTVVRVEWRNPHVYIEIAVENPAAGIVENWTLEWAPPHALQRSGWNAAALPAGQRLTVVGYPARDGGLRLGVKSIACTNGSCPPSPVLIAGN